MRSKAFAVVVSVILPAAVLAGSDSVRYQGGTVAIKDGTELRVDLAAPDAAVLAAKGQVVRIPWTGIKAIEYGRTALTALRAKSGQAVTCGDVEAAKYLPCENSSELVAADKKK
jgi:hypothetical protein